MIEGWLRCCPQTRYARLAWPCCPGKCWSGRARLPASRPGTIAEILEASMIKKSVVRQAISPGTSAALKVLAEQLREAMPANWAEVDEDWDAAIEIMNDE